MIGIHVRLHQHVRTCLAGRVGAVRIVRRCLIEKRGIVLRQAAVNLICGNMQKLLALLKASVRQLPCRLRTVQHNRGSQYIGLHEHFRIFNASVHMTLRRKMDHTINVILGKDPADRILVADIRFYKSIIVAILNIL